MDDDETTWSFEVAADKMEVRIPADYLMTGRPTAMQGD
jgi:hypothetical protein